MKPKPTRIKRRTDTQQRQAYGRRSPRTGNGRNDLRQLGRTGGSEDQGNAIDDKPGRECPEQEVLETGFLRIQARAGEGGKHVERDGEEFQRQENNDQVSRLGHQHHARHAEEQQGVIFTALDAHAPEVAIRQGNPEQPGCQEEHAQEGGKTVQHDHPAESEAFLPGVGEGQPHGRCQTDGGQESRPAFASLSG